MTENKYPVIPIVPPKIAANTTYFILESFNDLNNLKAYFVNII
ncbi:hypothetical protein CPC_0494 [Clostridium perfringens C str. JGS1495]|nr:hypothetical protein CPC_0494 [Clostridium perfringens C str. JGS1495]